MSYELTLNDWLPPIDDVSWDRVRLEFSQTGAPTGTDWIADDVQAISVDPTPLTPVAIDITTANFPWLEGYVRVVFLHADDSESLPSSPVYTMVTWSGGLRAMIPRTGRALQGFNVTLTDDQIASLLADAAAEIIWYAPSWGKTLVATSRDANNVPTSFEITPELSLPEQTVVVNQAALNNFYHLSQEGKIQETITNEANSWTYQKSATLLADHYKALIRARDDALRVLIEEENQALDTYVSFIAVRDPVTSAYIEPYIQHSLGVGGQTDWRFQ